GELGWLSRIDPPLVVDAAIRAMRQSPINQQSAISNQQSAMIYTLPVNALALDRPHPVAGDGLEQAGAVALIGVAGALQFSIALAQILLLIALVCWVATLIVKHERVTVPQFFLPLAAYAGATLVSAAFSSDPRTSLVDCKQLVLFLLVPAVVRPIQRPPPVL